MSVKVSLAALLVAFAGANFAPTAHGALPGTNGKIAFASDREGFCCDVNGNNLRDIYLLDGATTTKLPTDDGRYPPGPHSAFAPAWSPDGKKISFAGYDGLILMTVNEDGTDLREWAQGIHGFDSPSWSPDGGKIVFERLVEFCVAPDECGYTQSDLDVLDTSSGDIRQLVESDRVSDSGPAWSPDGSRIAYSGINMIAADGSCLPPCMTSSLYAGFSGGYPNWSSDGSKLVFSRFMTGMSTSEIFVRDLATGVETRLTNNTVNENNPAWSPDGTKVVFDRGSYPSREIFVMNADGSGQQQLTSNNVDDADPDWQPLGAFTNYPRPASATPTRFPLVPAFAHCTAPDSVHVAPLSLPACSSTSQVSDLLTTSSTGRGSGHVLLRAALGNPSTPEDEADILMRAQATDVICRGAGPGCASTGADYTGQLLFALEGTRITDKSSGFGEVSATAVDVTFSAPVSCTPTAGTTGSNCLFNTTADALLPGTAMEEKRTVLRVGNARLLDTGADGESEGSSCPPICGTGDEKVFLEQGVFTP
jgi:TolB protein